MVLMAKLFATCLNKALEQQAISNHWHAATQAGFRRHHHLEDLLILVDYTIARAQQQGQALSISLVDLEKAFDTVS